ncbi:MAG: GNAT family N-acetyltransferase [Candidatus Brocadiaceae bacterium]|nr:GNAT family N-acetyltransferase [Candidatus Brocadiaceae bacterium]
MPDKDLSVSIVRMDKMNALQGEWEALFEATSASPCASFDWFSNYVSHKQLTENVRVCVVKDSKGTVGIIPLWLKKKFAFGVLPINIATVTGAGWVPESPVLLAERVHGGMPVVQTALEKIYRMGEKWHYCSILVPRTSSVVLNDNRNVTDSPRIVCARKNEPGSIVVELPGSVDEYRKNLSGKSRRKIGQMARGLEQKGEVKLVRLGLDTSESEDKMLRLIEDSITVSRRSWQSKSKKGYAISDPDVQGFFTDVTLSLAKKGMVDLSVLYVRSKPISFDWGVARKGKVSGLKKGYDPEFRQFGPGIVHFARLIEDSIKRGITEIDLGIEFHEAKMRWSRKEHGLCKIRYYSPGLKARYLRWWLNLRGAV